MVFKIAPWESRSWNPAPKSLLGCQPPILLVLHNPRQKGSYRAVLYMIGLSAAWNSAAGPFPVNAV